MWRTLPLWKPFLVSSRGLVFSRSSLSTFQQDASHSLQAAQSDVSPESPLYNEREVREWLGGFPGGSVDLSIDSATKIATVTLNNPKKRNSLSGKMMVDLADVVQELVQYREGVGVVVCGAGSQFCSGGDLDFMRRIADPTSGAKMSIFMQTVVSKLNRLPMPSLAMIEGFALGGGAELSVACDFRAGTEACKIGFVQTRLGVTTGWGGGTNLTRLLGQHNALQLLLSGKVLSGSEARALGLLDAFVADVNGSRAWFQKSYLEGGYGPSIRAAKRVVQNAAECGYSEAMNRERDVFARLWGGPGHIQAMDKLKK